MSRLLHVETTPSFGHVRAIVDRDYSLVYTLLYLVGDFFQSLISLSMDAETEPVAVQKEEEQVSSKEVVRNGCVLLVLRDH